MRSPTLLIAQSDQTSSFTCETTISDIDNNIYETVQIGNQCWMGSNLKVSKYNDGTTIPNVTDPSVWSTLNTGAWSYYDDDVTNNTQLGKLYNFYVVDNEKNVCPVGWKVPTDEEWNIISNYLGSSAGYNMKSTSAWINNGNGNNSSGFNALPAGRKGSSGSTYTDLGRAARFWSTTENNINNGWIYRLTYDNDELQRDYNQKKNAFSIRCMLDSQSSVSIENQLEIPENIILHQNYPNPFNPTTNIRFTLSASDQVTLEISDVSGRKIISLLNNAKYGSGHHTVVFDSATLSSGVYIYTLRTASNHVITRKMMLIK